MATYVTILGKHRTLRIAGATALGVGVTAIAVGIPVGLSQKSQAQKDGYRKGHEAGEKEGSAEKEKELKPQIEEQKTKINFLNGRMEDLQRRIGSSTPTLNSGASNSSAGTTSSPQQSTTNTLSPRTVIPTNTPISARLSLGR